jgi:hypothetical protein
MLRLNTEPDDTLVRGSSCEPKSESGCLFRSGAGTKAIDTVARWFEESMNRSMRSPARRGAAAVWVALAFAGGLASCYEPQAQRLSCDDVLPAGTYDFAQVQALVQDQQKGCQGDECHGGAGQEQGVRLDEPALVYDEFSHRPEKFYAVLASGFMPEEGTPWSDDDLKLLRSWYCNGAFPP